MRGRIISYTAAHKREIKQRYAKASYDLRQKQLVYQSNPSIISKKEWIDAKFQFNLSQDETQRMHKSHRELKFLKYGNKPGKLLSYLTKETCAPINIPRIRTGNGETSSDPIREILRKLILTTG